MTDYEKLIPSGIIFNLSEIEKMKLLNIAMAKKLIKTKKIESVKVGNKLHISRDALIKYLNKNTIVISGNDL